MSTSTSSSTRKPEFYNLIIEAQKFDAIGDDLNAFVSYLNGVNSLSTFLLRESQCLVDDKCTSNEDDSGLIFSLDVKNGIKTLKLCVERLEAIAVKSGDQIDSSENSKLEKPSPPIPTIPTFITPIKTTVVNNISVSQPLPTSTSSAPLTPIEKANKENALLSKIFQTRIRNIKDPGRRAMVELELQRRMIENIQLAKVKEAERYQEQHLREQQALEEAAKKLLQHEQLLNNVNNMDSESLASRQHLYAQILQYETLKGSSPVKRYKHKRTPSIDAKTMNDMVSDILCHVDHPLSIWMKKFQYQIINRIDPLLKQYYTQKNTRDEENMLLVDLDDSHSGRCFSSDCARSEVTVDKLEVEAFQRHFNIIANDISSAHETITLLLTLIIFDNEHQTSNNCDFLRQQNYQLHSVVADYLYPPLWALITNLTRIVNSVHEIELHRGMQEMLLSSNDFQTDSLNVLDPSVIEQAANQLKSIIPLQTPYAKLKALVRLTQRLCTQMKSASSGQNKDVGADDLVPILCVVVLKSGSPQLISECDAIEQLVDNKYLLGEEGYCLSSFQTALKYIEINARNRPSPE